MIPTNVCICIYQYQQVFADTLECKCSSLSNINGKHLSNTNDFVNAFGNAVFLIANDLFLQ